LRHVGGDIEKHYGRYIKNDSREQLERLFGEKAETLCDGTDDEANQVFENAMRREWSGRVDLNHTSKKKPHK